MKNVFIPPNMNYPIMWMVDQVLGPVLKLGLNIDSIEILPEDREMLKGLKNERLIFFTNHPTAAEPPIAYYVGNQIGDKFYFMASRQVFDWGGGILGKILPMGGAYSVIAGTADRGSMKMSRRLLAKPKGKLVIFPEGEPIGGENDNLLPFQGGVAQLSFWGLQDAMKADPSATVKVLPGFVRYVIQSPPRFIQKQLEQKVSRMEDELFLTNPSPNLLRRFLRVARVLLENEEKFYSMKVEPDQDFDYRVGHLRHYILDHVADKIGYKYYDKNADAIHKLRQLFALIEMMEIKFPDKHVPRLNKRQIEWARNEVMKAYQFIVIKRDYLINYPSAERFYEWVLPFEYLLFGGTKRGIELQSSHLPRKAHVFFAPVFELNEYLPLYKTDRKQAVAAFNDRTRADMQKLLDDSLHLTRPLVEPGKVD